MAEERVYIGVDVSKAWRVENNASGISGLIERIRGLSLERIVVEATGGYESLFVETLLDAGLRVVGAALPLWGIPPFNDDIMQ